MDIKVSKSDFIWSYFAQFFNIAAGLLTLPLILHMLSTEEIAMNYLMMTIGSMVAMIDFGFAPQFGRNITYVFSGAQQLEKVGLNNEISDNINYHLLRCLIDVAKKVYRYMSIIVLLLMLTLGTWYIYMITDGFLLVKNSLLIWGLYSLSTYFNVYFFYYSSLLSGRGLVKEERKAMLASRSTYLVLSYILLLCGQGLIGLCIANLISPFVSRWLSYYYFYDNKLVRFLSLEKSTSQEIRELFVKIWYNAKRLGITTIGGYAVLKFCLFIAGLYLTMTEVSSLGLMMQLVNVITAVSTTFFITLIPRMTSYKVGKEYNKLISLFSWAMNVFYIIYISLSIFILAFGPILLSMIGSNATLPVTTVTICYLLVTFLEQNHGLYAAVITMGNSVPYFKAGIISGFFVCIGDILVLQFTNTRLLGLVLVQGLVQLVYQNWYWPRWVCKELNISFCLIVKNGFEESFNRISNCLRKR